MAELLLYYRDPERGYEIGDVISAAHDGQLWGDCECVDNFLVIRLPGLSREDAQAYTEELDGDIVGRRRRYKIDINASMAASGIDPDTFGLVYCEDWLVHEITNLVLVDKASL
jgi:hypothetical protein